ncbi:MAG: T9SS type A sorting domain-containing protein, partial [Bacteroidota bacterium]
AGGVAQTSGTTSNDFTDAVTYTITAEDGTTTQDWVVTVTEEVVLNDETDILSYGFGIPPQTGAASIDEANHTVDIEVESGTDVTGLVATFTLSDGATTEVGGVAQSSGTTSNDFSSPVIYTIIAEDGTTEQDWIVTVTEEVVLNNETEILTFDFAESHQVGEAHINSTTDSIEVVVSAGTDLTDLVATFTLSYGATATVNEVTQISGTISNDFSNPVTYTITAEDGITTRDWIVLVKLATGINESFIQTFKVYPNPFFDKTIVEFNNNGHSKYRLAMYDITGQKVREWKNIGSDKIELKRENLKTGVYFIELATDKVLGSKKVIIK